MLNRIVSIFSVPIMIMNFASGIIGGIWLAFLGKWGLIGIGLLFSLTSHWIFTLLMLPSLALIPLGVYLYEKKNPLRHVVNYISQLYTNILIIITIFFAYSVCRSFYTGNMGVGYIPYLLWSWGMALGPWQFFASKEPDNAFSAITLFSASVFYFLFLSSLFISPALVIIVLLVFGFVQLIALPIFNMYLERQMQND
ncbi:MAG: hypothetical protein LLF28_02440 [Nitrospiraceae bacterium]|nr:hypothetical protein [Nitrospiraceae bacterium]